MTGIIQSLSELFSSPIHMDAVTHPMSAGEEKHTVQGVWRADLDFVNFKIQRLNS